MANGNRHVDVCVVCAKADEAQAVVKEFSSRCRVSYKQDFIESDNNYKYEYDYMEIKNEKKEALTVLVTCLAYQGPVQTASFVTFLLNTFHPRFAAMTGYCAGDKTELNLGDLVVAEAAYHYEQGKVKEVEDGQKLPFPLIRPKEPAVNIIQYVNRFNAWKKPVGEIKPPEIEDSLADSNQVKCLIGYMASGMAVRRDNPFEELRSHNHKTVALEMEAAAFYEAASSFSDIYSLVVKGVCDYADMNKHDEYHEYTARVSATYLLYFIQKYVTTITMPRRRSARNRINFSAMLGMLRVRVGLTQSDAADLLGISNRTIQNWESGVSIPQQEERLKQLIEILLVQDAFSEGREQEEAEVLWELAGKNVPFDVEWFKKFLTQKTSSSGINIFYCYADKDEPLRDEFEKHLSSLRRQGYITEWHDRCIVPGTDWTAKIDSRLMRASVILLLVSPDFLASDYVYSVEMKQTLERHKAGKARVIPIILRPVDWSNAPFARLQALPREGKPVTKWEDKDAAFLEVSKGIRRVIEELRTPEFVESDVVGHLPSYPSRFYQLYEVFVKSGVPRVTFVEREDFGLLKLALAQPGRGVVIEGPSGIGKTTAVERAIEALSSRQHGTSTESIMQILSARNPEHRSKLQTLRQWHLGTVIIDDFHRLDPQLQGELIDYLKYLADTERASKKLVIVGIPQTGQTLVDTSFDVATRIDVFKLGLVNDELLLRMIEKGEEALNIKFDRKSEIFLAAGGSLNIAQFLCFNICYREKLIETQKKPQPVSRDIDAAVVDVLTSLLSISN